MTPVPPASLTPTGNLDNHEELNGKVFTGRFSRPLGLLLFERICRERGITQRFTKVRSPTTTGKIERFHKTVQAELLTGSVFADLAEAQTAIDAWVIEYNTRRPHQALQMHTPAERFIRPPQAQAQAHAEAGPPAAARSTTAAAAAGSDPPRGTGGRGAAPKDRGQRRAWRAAGHRLLRRKCCARHRHRVREAVPSG
jgi:integrase-like protein